MPKRLLSDIEWQSVLWSDIHRPQHKRLEAENAFYNFPVGKLEFIQRPQVWEIIGEEKFYRFANPLSILTYNDPGAWWTDRQTYVKLKENARRNGTKFSDDYRSMYAVSRDWSDLDHLYELQVPSNQTILAVIGETKYQPEFSDKSEKQTNLIFMGRGLQIYFRGEDLRKFTYQQIPLVY